MCVRSFWRLSSSTSPPLGECHAQSFGRMAVARGPITTVKQRCNIYRKQSIKRLIDCYHWGLVRCGNLLHHLANVTWAHEKGHLVRPCQLLYSLDCTVSLGMATAPGSWTFAQAIILDMANAKLCFTNKRSAPRLVVGWGCNMLQLCINAP